MEPFKDDNDLIAELHALRPTPRPAYAAELDERAAAGFPRRSPREAAPPNRLLAWLRALPARRLGLAIGATALAAIAIATVVVGVQGPRTDSNPSSGSNLLGFTNPVDSAGSAAAAPSASAPERASGATGAGESTTASTGPFASKTGQRDVERSAEIVLGAEPSEVADNAAKVFDAVHAVDGIVLSSSVTGGIAGAAGAKFDLLIPSAKLGDALSAFSGIAEVRSRHEATDDITAPTVRLGEHLRDSRATIDGLLVQLAGADTDSERAEVEAELSAERRHAASLRSQATKLDRRANLSRVSLRIETGAGSSSGGSDSGWGIGDAFGDAGHILAIAVSVTIVGLAIIAPLALIALLAWLASRAWIRRSRERALE